MKSASKLSLIISSLLVVGMAIPLLSSSSLAKPTSFSVKNPVSSLNNANFLKGWQRTRSPRWWGFGATRGVCKALKGDVIAILPHDSVNDPKTNKSELVSDQNIWGTTSAYPQIFMYLPALDSSKVESESFPYEAQFILSENTGKLDAKGNKIVNKIYDVTVKLPQGEGLVRLDFSDSSQFPFLETDKQYSWQLQVSCNGEYANAQEIGGWIEKIDDPNITAALNDSDPKTHSAIYEEANAWYDAVSNIVQLMEQYPNDPTIKTQWQELIQETHRSDELTNPTVIGTATIEDN
jgi:hypothetical protein